MDRNERVTGIVCSSVSSCVVATDRPGGEGHVYATNQTMVTRTLVTGDDDLAAQFGTLGTIAFLGLTQLGDRLVARTRGAEAAFISAAGDVTALDSWTPVVVGTPSGAQFGLNAQFAMATHAGRYVFVSNGRIYEAYAAPGPSALWTNIWSPQAVPPIPSDIDDLRDADPTLCNTDPTVSVAPNVLQPAFVSSDLAVIVTVAGTVNQSGDDEAGVCISTDGGLRFHHVSFPDIDLGSGPVGVACTTNDHCIAYGGLRFREDSAFVFITHNATDGADSTWVTATTPTFVEDTELRYVFFAPDQVHGWIVGAAGPAAPLLLATTDGGSTWTDITSQIRHLVPDVRLHSGFALDPSHVWIGGERDALLVLGD